VQIIRYAGSGGARVGVQAGDDIAPLPVPSLGDLLALPLDELRELTERASPPLTGGAPRLLPPVDGLTEVWASGVTYERSSAARQEESQVADVYARVYGAERPELFFKSPAWRVCGPGEPIGIRPDSPVNVPEPELAVVCTARGEIAGVTICNDVSSRSIEGENPLYLPQAKVYTGACALGPGIVPVWELPDLGSLTITAAVRRGDAVAWQGQTSTAQLHRSLDDLVAYLFRCAVFPAGAVLSTGTGLVPELDFTLEPGDEVRIDIAGLGSLTNVVRPATAQWFSWLTPVPDRDPNDAGNDRGGRG
jgi:2-dehydro-3-deoxy-D-arabinonate dehydratase